MGTDRRSHLPHCQLLRLGSPRGSLVRTERTPYSHHTVGVLSSSRFFCNSLPSTHGGSRTLNNCGLSTVPLPLGYVSMLWAWRDLNPHALRHQLLRLACLHSTTSPWSMSCWCQWRASNPQTLGFKPSRYTDSLHTGIVVPAGFEPTSLGLQPNATPTQLQDHCCEWVRRESNPQSPGSRPDRSTNWRTYPLYLRRRRDSNPHHPS